MVITISNRYGCGGVEIAQLAAGRLGYEFVDQQLPIVVAKRLKTTPDAVESAESAAGSVSERMLRALESGTPELGAAPATAEDFDAECVREVQEAVREFAAHGNNVIMGRAGNLILGRRPELVRVFLYAPRDWRIRHIAEWHRVDERVAASEVDRVDRAREHYVRVFYSTQWGDPQNYDLCIDTSHFGTERSVALIVDAARER